MTKNEVAKKNTSLANIQDFGADAGVGNDIQMDDLKIPFLKLLQALSPAVQKGTDGYVEGAEPGMLMNSATEELFDGEEGVNLVLAFRRKSFVEWRPNRGGFAGDHEPSSRIVREAQAAAAKPFELFTPEGNSLEETKSLYAIQLDNEGTPVGYLVIPFTGSKMSAWRNYFTKLDSARVPDTSKKVTDLAPLYAMGVKLVSKSEVNKKGEPYKNYELKPANGNILNSIVDKNSPAFEQAKALHEAIGQGRASADYDTHENNQGADEEDSF